MRGLAMLALAALAVVLPALVIVKLGEHEERGDGSGAAVLVGGVEGDHGRKTALVDTDTNKVVWEPLRPEHQEYYPSKIYLFTGQESTLYGRQRTMLAIRNILSKGNPRPEVKSFNSLRVAALRAVAWDKGAHVMVFPAFSEYPDLHMISKTDIRGYASGGNNVVFLGGFGSIDVINEIFGFQLDSVPYQDGPFYRSNRNVRNTVMETMPSMVPEGGSGTYGVRIKSLPPGARSYYDSLGDSVLWSVRYDLGMVTYVGSSLLGPVGNGIWHKLLRAAVAL